jgi:glycosyl transferase, family 25
MQTSSPPHKSTLPSGIDAIFVVHAKKFLARRHSIESQMGAFGLPYEFVLEFDIGDIPGQLKETLLKDSPLTPAQQSCALKHWRAHQLIVERRLSRVLILEDDVIFLSHFSAALQGLMREELALGDPHVTFLGCGGHYYIPHAQIRAGQWLYPASQGNKFADSYIVSMATAQRRLDWIAEHGITDAIDHLFEKIDRTLGTPMFWLEPPAVEQGSHNGKFESALDKSHDRWFQALQFRWKKLWRRRNHQ